MLWLFEMRIQWIIGENELNNGLLYKTDLEFSGFVYLLTWIRITENFNSTHENQYETSSFIVSFCKVYVFQRILKNAPLRCF